MSERRSVVLEEISGSARVPEWASAGVVLIEWLQRRGLWVQLTERLKIQREGGYAGIDAFVFLIYLFTSGLRLGLKEFSERARKPQRQLAAVGGRERLPTQASMSRMLASVSPEMLKGFGPWLLREAVDVAAVLNHPSVLTRDAQGAGWHVFDWDPTVTTLRHRALPVFDDMPQARRRSEALAKAGYPGRKRGDVQFSRGTLQHAGSGLWLGIEMGTGNGAHRQALESAVEQVLATCHYAQLAVERALLRMDGAAGNVPAISSCIKAGLHFVTRLAHYQLLDSPDIKRHLNEATWYEVPSSGSGPTRQATDLGRVTLEAASTSVQADGKVFAPVEARVVVSRFVASGEGRGAGTVIDGWQYELYGTNLPPAAWPEVEVVAGYYGRCGQENRFSQEDSELGLDRIFSYHLAGQQLTNLIGLFVWNFSICRGMDLTSPPDALPMQAASARTPVEPTPRLPEAESTAATPTTGAVQNETVVAGDAQTTHQPIAVVKPTAAVRLRRQAEPLEASSITDAKHAVNEMLNLVDWQHALRHLDDWSYVANTQSLLCPARNSVPLARIEHVQGQPIRARFQADSGLCDSCQIRPTCIKSLHPLYRKEVRVSVPPPHAGPLRELWLKATHSHAQIQTPTKPIHTSSTLRPTENARNATPKKTLLWFPLQPPTEQILLEVAPPRLLPAELRKQTRAAARSLEIEIIVDHAPAPEKPSPMLAGSPGERQKRRQTWPERLRFNKLRPGSSVQIRLSGLNSVVMQKLLPTVATAPAKAA